MAITKFQYKNGKNLDWTLFLLWAITCIVLIFSLYQEFIAKIEPCKLCKWQRAVYFLVFLLIPFGLTQRYIPRINFCLKCFFFAGLCLALYHTTIQFGWVLDFCSIHHKIENMNDFIQMLEQPKVSCATNNLTIFGISIVIYNAIFSLLALVFLYFEPVPLKINL